jgi:hypothetical protein
MPHPHETISVWDDLHKREGRRATSFVEGPAYALDLFVRFGLASIHDLFLTIVTVHYSRTLV